METINKRLSRFINYIAKNLHQFIFNGNDIHHIHANKKTNSFQHFDVTSKEWIA